MHKAFLVCTIISTTDGVQPHYQRKRFSTYNGDLHRFADWLHSSGCPDVCMESTGKYWVPAFSILEARSVRVTIANPKWVKAVKGNKDDTKDSKWIGDLFHLGLVPSSFIPPKPIRILREFTRYRYKLVSMRSSEKNRFQNAFTVCNVALDSVVADMFGKSAIAITDYLISTEAFDPEHCVSLLKRSLKQKADSVLESIEGYSMTPEQKFRMRVVRAHLDYIEQSIAQIDTEIDAMVALAVTACAFKIRAGLVLVRQTVMTCSFLSRYSSLFFLVQESDAAMRYVFINISHSLYYHTFMFSLMPISLCMRSLWCREGKDMGIFAVASYNVFFQQYTLICQRETI